MDCVHCDTYGFCRIYSDLDVDVMCPGDGDCEKYMEVDNQGRFKPGTRFIGHYNGALLEVVKIENNVATIRDVKTGKSITYGLRALEKCLVTILEDEDAET